MTINELLPLSLSPSPYWQKYAVSQKKFLKFGGKFAGG